MRRLAETALGVLAGAGLMLVSGASARPAPHPQFAIHNPQSPDWRVVGVVVEDGAGARYTLPLAGLDAPVPTATPPPTNTPRPAPTTTSTPTMTREPALTATTSPTATRAPGFLTPTQEITVLPPLTPRPTTVPDEALCMAGVRTSALNIRAGHSTAATVVGRLAQGERVPVDALFVRYPEGSVNREEWGRVPGRGWIALWHGGSQLAVLDDSLACWEVPIQYASAKPAEPFGLHLIHSARAEVLTVPRLGLLKGTDGTEGIIRAAKKQRPGLLTLWRNLSTGAGWRDCPAGWGQGDARAVATEWWGAQVATWRARGLLGYVDYFEVVNECGAPYWRWENAFWLRALELASAARVCLAVFSDAYGTPELITWNARRPILDTMLSTECMPGRRHALSLHSYEGAESGDWKFGRWRLIMTLLGEEYRAIPIIFTEYGYATGDAPADCPRFWADWLLAEAQYANDPQIWGVAHFSVGASGVWTDVGACLGQMVK